MTPIAPLITSFLREHMPIEQGCSPHTCETYAHAFRLLFIFASKRLGIRPSQICLEQIDATLILDFPRSHRGTTWQLRGHAQRTTRCSQSLYPVCRIPRALRPGTGAADPRHPV